jgi:hypothetical protein
MAEEDQLKTLDKTMWADILLISAGQVVIFMIEKSSSRSFEPLTS